MKRYLAVLLAALLLMTSVPLVSADSYNDDQFDWGEYACPHTHIEEVAEIPSTCMVQGSSGYTRCLDCKLLLSGSREPLPLADHTYDNACDADCNVCGDLREVGEHSYDSVVTAPDCVSGGYTTYTCSACGDTYVADETAALGHDYVPLSAEPSTCVEDGFERYYCTHCYDSYTIVLAATGHSYDSVVTAPDCVSGGYTTYTCSACGDTYVADETAALGHNYVPLSAEPSTCVEDGFERYDCTHCHDSYTIVLEATGHSYDSVVTAPDCENSGYTVHTCTVCGDSYADGRVDALGHTYALTEHVAPTCVADGKQVYVCAACSDSYTDILPATGRHIYDFICDERCNVCGYINPDAHVYGFMGTVDPSCGEDGSHGYKCWECGKYKYIIIPATGDHTYSGVCDASCNVCDQIRESVDSHTYVLTEDVAVTCTTDGKQVYTCRGCGDSYTNTVTAQGHTYRIVVTAPTCEQGGYTTHTCTACGDVIVDNRTSALGHSYDTVITAPDCVNGGYTTYTCTACGDSYIADETHALGHVYDDDRDADCNVCGAIREVVTSLPGDANGDGKVNNRDLGMLQKHLNGSAANIDVEAMDVNDDGKVNNRDLGLLQQYLNGKDVILK